MRSQKQVQQAGRYDIPLPENTACSKTAISAHLSRIGDDSRLDLPFWIYKDAVSRITLRRSCLALAVPCDDSTLAYFGQPGFQRRKIRSYRPHITAPCSCQHPSGGAMPYSLRENRAMLDMAASLLNELLQQSSMCVSQSLGMVHCHNRTSLLHGREDIRDAAKKWLSCRESPLQTVCFRRAGQSLPLRRLRSQQSRFPQNVRCSLLIFQSPELAKQDNFDMSRHFSHSESLFGEFSGCLSRTLRLPTPFRAAFAGVLPGAECPASLGQHVVENTGQSRTHGNPTPDPPRVLRQAASQSTLLFSTYLPDARRATPVKSQ